MWALLFVGVLALLVISICKVRNSELALRATRLASELSKLRIEVHRFNRHHATQLTPRDRQLASALANFDDPTTARTLRLLRFYSTSYKAHRTVSVSRFAIDAVDEAIVEIQNLELLDFYYRYQQILLDGLEAHLPARSLARWLPPKWRIALLPKATHDRQLQGLHQWYTRRVYELRA